MVTFLCCHAAWASVVPPKPTTPVYDGAGVLTPQQKSELENKLVNFKKQRGPEIAVAILPTLGEEDINDVRYDIFNAWGIGDKERKDGVLLLLVVDKAKAAGPGADRCGCAGIEIGEYVESIWTDTQSKRILRDQILAPVVEGKFHEAANVGVDAIMGTFNSDSEAAKDYKNDADAGGTTEQDEGGTSIPWWVWVGLIALAIVLHLLGVPILDILLIFLSFGGGRGGGGDGGGGSSFGGGGSSGGGGGSI